MIRWATLAAEIQRGRDSVAAARLRPGTELRRRLTALANRNFCKKKAAAWLEDRAQGKMGRVELSDDADGRVNGYPALLLNNLSHLADGASLVAWVNYDRRSQRLLEFEVALTGRSRVADMPWYARVELDTCQKGQGPCGHPLLHCHVGVVPDTEPEPKARVPMPWLYPWEVLDWLLATVEPMLEPADEAPGGEVPQT